MITYGLTQFRIVSKVPNASGEVEVELMTPSGQVCEVDPVTMKYRDTPQRFLVDQRALSASAMSAPELEWLSAAEGLVQP